VPSVEEPSEKIAVLQALSANIIPGPLARHPRAGRAETAAKQVIAITIREA